MKSKSYFGSLPRGVLWLGVVSLINDLSSEVIMRVLPLFLIAVVNSTFVGVGFVEAVADGTAVLGRLGFGYFSDRIKKRKPFIVGGYGLSVLARPLLLWGNVLAPVVISRFLDKVGKSIRTAPRDALIADLSDETNRGKNFGIHRAMDTIGAVLGLVGVVAFLRFKPMSEDSALKWILVWASAVGALTLPFLIFCIKDPAKHKTEIKTSPRLSIKRMNSSLRIYLIIAFFFALANSSDAFLMIRAKEAGFDLMGIFLILVAFNVVSVPAYALFAGLSDKWGRKTLLSIGWIIYVISYFIFGLPHFTRLAFIGAMMIYGLYYGATDGVEKAMVADFETAGNKGQAYGWLALVQGIGIIPANLLFGFFYQKMGPTWAFWFSGLTAGIGVVGLGFFNPKKAH